MCSTECSENYLRFVLNLQADIFIGALSSILLYHRKQWTIIPHSPAVHNLGFYRLLHFLLLTPKLSPVAEIGIARNISSVGAQRIYTIA